MIIWLELRHCFIFITHRREVYARFLPHIWFRCLWTVRKCKTISIGLFAWSFLGLCFSIINTSLETNIFWRFWGFISFGYTYNISYHFQSAARRFLSWFFFLYELPWVMMEVWLCSSVSVPCINSPVLLERAGWWLKHYLYFFFLGKISAFYKFQVIFSSWFKESIWVCTLDKWQAFDLRCNPNINNIWSEGGSKLH